MADKSKTIIIRKSRKGHAAHHGGSWKVAYADFVTAMMALFLLLWLISMVTPEKRAIVADYFKNYSLFSQSGRSFMAQSSGIKQELRTSSVEPVTGEPAVNDAKIKLKGAIANRLESLREAISMETVDGGIKIQITDVEGKPMFAPGSVVPNERCKYILKILAESLADSKTVLAVEGHTDSSGSKKSKLSNWEISTARASSARIELEKSGIDPSRISRIVGYADTDPLFPEAPEDPRNRRISILVMPEKPKKVPAPVATPTEQTPQTLPVIPPKTAEPAATGEQKTIPFPSEKKVDEKNRVLDPGVKPHKPIDIRPTLFPGN